MAHVTLGRPKTGRHPAMWQSVPMKSFIQPSVSQHLVSKEHNEHSTNSNCSKKDTSGSKYYSPKSKVDTCHHSNSGKNVPSRNGGVEDGGSNNSQMCRTRATLNPHSAQRHQSNFSKSSNNPSFHAPSQNFLSNEDDFPSLCGSNTAEITEAATTVHETSSSVNTSYSEKLKLICDTSYQNKVEEKNVSAEKEMPSNNLKRNSFTPCLPMHDKKTSNGNRRNYPIASAPVNHQDLSNQQWYTPHRSNKKSTHAGSRNLCDIDQVGISPIQNNQSENQRGRIHHPHVKANETHIVTEIGGDDDDGKISSFLSKTQGNTMNNSFSTKLKGTGEHCKPDLSNNRHVESAKTDLRKDFSPFLKSASKSKRPIVDEMKEKYCSEVPNNCENVPNVRAVGKMRTGIKNNAPRSSKMMSKYPPSGDEKERGVNSDLSSHQESATNSQQGTSKTSKKRKNRKSKLKRNLAFQTGKIMILTPELYSRFTGNLASSHNRTPQDFSFDLSDMEEYPQLGQVNNLCSDHHKKTMKVEIIDSCINHECDPAPNSTDDTLEQLLSDDQITSKEANNASQNANLLHKNLTVTVAKSEQSIQSFIGGTVETNGGGASKKPPRKRVAALESEKIPISEEKVPPLVPEQKPKIRHDCSIQISFSDILSSSMVKVKNETSKSRKQNDSRIKVISSKKVKMDKNLHTPPNPLDSSRPGVKRGKERERPKPKKHTPLKRIILKERSEKKQKNMPVKQEDLGNEASYQKAEEQEIFLSDKERETETDVDAEDPNDSLCNYLTIGECASECCEGAKDKRLDENLNFTVDTLNESSIEKTEEICDILSEEKKMQAIQIAIHTRHFREYCNHLLSAEIDQVTLALLGDLTRFQDRLHQKDPVKARIKRRLVYGIKEVTKHLKLKKVKCVILAPDSENIKSKGGLNDAVSEIVRVSAEYHIPCVFALRRKTLGKACLKPVPVACVGIFNYDGSEANFKKLLELQAESKKAYDAVMANFKEQIAKDEVEQLIDTQENAPQSLQDLRITILRETLLEKNPDLHLVFTPSGNVQLGCKEE